jgi:hypothetical protein
MMSCDNGYPEDGNNLGAALLGRGALATASASRAAVGEGGEGWQPRPDLASATDAAYYFVLLLQSGQPVGDALAFTKWALPGDGWNGYQDKYGSDLFDLNAYAWMTKLEYNLYGDPTLRIERCVHDAECDDQLPCNGREECRAGYCVHVDPVVCPAQAAEPCLANACDNRTGRCAPLPVVDGMPCEDGAWCTVSDQCSAGQCVGSDRVCAEHDGYRAQCDELRDECTLVSLADSPLEAEATTGESTMACSAQPRSAAGQALIWIFMLSAVGSRALRRRRSQERS